MYVGVAVWLYIYIGQILYKLYLIQQIYDVIGVERLGLPLDPVDKLGMINVAVTSCTDHEI